MGKELESDEFKKLLSLGEEKGFLTYDDVNDLLPSDIISSDQIDDIITLFGERNIDIIDTDKGEKLVVKKTADDLLAKEEDIFGQLSATGKTGDPVKLYLREMGMVSLLSREGEVEIAKRIEEGIREVMDSVFSVALCVADVVAMAEKLRSGELRVRNIVDNLEDDDGFVEEDIHRDRVLNLLDKIAALHVKNEAIRAKLRSKSVKEAVKTELRRDLERNTKDVVRHCRSIRFSKKQIDRLVSLLKDRLAEIKRIEGEIQGVKDRIGLSLGQLEKAWTRLRTEPDKAHQVARDFGTTLAALKEAEAEIKELNRQLRKVSVEVGMPISTFKKTVATVTRGEAKADL
ncbi:MAG: RNA polymerase sigma factor RpoD, partial [Syntrophales bacterium]|nr:RNA polymerase sigma factor RpoD [Syntrophales bacterium]